MSNSLREPRSPARQRTLTTMVDRWVESLESDTDRGADGDGAPVTDEPASSRRLLFAWNGGRLAHAGRLHPSSQPSAALEECVRAAGHPRAGLALWRALHHFGAPFDAINTHRWNRGPFSWGTWGFDAVTTVAIISAASGAGEAISANVPESESAALPAALEPLRAGDAAALAALVAQPHAMTQLADTACLPDVQHRQIDVIADRSLRPLAHDRFTDVELLALLVLDQRVGLGTARELIAQVASTGGTSGTRGSLSWVAIATRHLADAGQPLTRREWQHLSTVTHGRG